MAAEIVDVELNDEVIDNKDDVFPNAIHVLRYIRPTDEDGLPDNMYGITISYIMDYDNRKVYAQWAICNGEQFSRKIGTVVALLSDRYACFDMELVDLAKGLNNALKTVLISALFESNEPIGDDYNSTHALFKLGKDTLSKNGNMIISMAEE